MAKSFIFFGQAGTGTTDGVAAASGVATIIAIGASIFAAVGASAGAATVSGRAVTVAVASASGSSTVSGDAAVSSVAASAGAGAALAVGSTIRAGVAVSAGAGVAAATGQTTAAARADAVGTSAASGQSAQAGVGTSAGVGAATGVAALVHQGVAVSAGAGTASAVGRAPTAAVALSMGFAVVHGNGIFGFVGGVAAKQPNSWLTVFTRPYPEVVEPPVLRWGPLPLSDQNRHVAGRLTEVGSIERGSSDKEGHYTPARLQVTSSDADAALRTLLGGDDTRHLRYREAEYDLLSYAGRKANLMERPLIKGRIIDAEPPPERRGMIEIEDFMGAHLGVLPPDKLVGRLLGDEHTNLPDASKERIYNILFGEHSDKGSLDANGASAEKGLVSPVYSGMYDISDGTSPPPTVLPPPVIQDFGTVGGSGSKTYYYAASLITPFGESSLSNVVGISGKSNRNLSNYNFISGTYTDLPGKTRVRIWRSENATTFTHWLDGANYDGSGVFGYADGAAPWPNVTRDELDDPKRLTPIPVTTATIDEGIWGRFVVAIGYVEVLGAPFASDLADGAEPKRVRLAASLEGVEWITAASPQWPHANPWIELTNSDSVTIRQTVFYLRGPRLQHHIDGAVTVTVNVCGYKGLNGLMINQASYVLFTLLNEFVEKNEGEGYLTGDFGPVEAFADATPKFLMSRIQAAQQLTVEQMGTTLGALGAIPITEPTTVGDILRFATASWGFRYTTNHRGQFYWYLINAASVIGVPYRERMEMKKVVDHRYAWDEAENRIRWQYHWDPDAQAFRNPVEPTSHDASIVAHGGEKLGVFMNPSVREMRYTNDEATARWCIAQQLLLYAYPPRYLSFTTDLRGVEDQNGDPLRITIRKEGLGLAGETLAPAVLMRHATRVKPYEVQHTVRMLAP
jgi:hypothetical protein